MNHPENALPANHMDGVGVWIQPQGQLGHSPLFDQWVKGRRHVASMWATQWEKTLALRHSHHLTDVAEVITGIGLFICLVCAYALL